jgi:alcohol dehydrogenase class IV
LKYIEQQKTLPDHKETAHYNIWRETVADMMVEPRVGIAYSNVFPDEAGLGMSKVFEFTTPNRLIFGENAVSDAGKITAAFGKRAVVVTGTGAASTERLFHFLQESGVQFLQLEVASEPDVDFVDNCIQAAFSFNANVVVGFGGGSSIDTAKAVSAMLTNPGELLDYLEVVGKGHTLRNPAAPCIAIPTTAGTGSEVTRNAVLGFKDQKMKVSMRSPLMLPQVALIDPELTYSLSPAVTAATGMDAITQVLEPYVSVRANPMTDLFCREGLQTGPNALLRAYRDGEDREARSKMAWTSLMGGLALANSGLGAVHGFASPIGGMFNAPHGAVCARLLAPVMAANVQALKDRAPESSTLERYTEAAQWITGNNSACVEDGIEWLKQLTVDLDIPSLSEYGLTAHDIPVIVEKAAKASSMKANPVRLRKKN